MDKQQQLKLQSFLDGELPEAEARDVAAWIARDNEARALHAELKNTRKAIKTSEPDVKLPESRGFFWSKIEREIQRLEPAPQPRETVSTFEWIRRLVMPASAAAVLLIAGLITYNQLGFGARVHPESEMAMADSGAFTYRDYSGGVTLVWLPFPAENDLAQSASPATIQ